VCSVGTEVTDRRGARRDSEGLEHRSG
jgi:hypothetical protein